MSDPDPPLVEGSGTPRLRDSHHEYDGGVGGYDPPLHDPHPGQCTHWHRCEGHGEGHVHEPGCGHKLVAHAGHSDWLVGDHLHSVHGPHCHSHGSWTLAPGEATEPDVPPRG